MTEQNNDALTSWADQLATLQESVNALSAIEFKVGATRSVRDAIARVNNATVRLGPIVKAVNKQIQPGQIAQSSK